jgi:DNA-directed RNA polymerase subunit RPC12/RpoP
MGHLIELTCPNCGAKLERIGDAPQAQCPHCGSQLVIERKAIAVAPAESSSCPKCRKDDCVRKVTAVHHAGLSSGSYSGHVWTDEGFDSVSLSGRTQTAVSRLLSPPKEPSSVTWLGRILTGWGLGFLLFLGGGCLCVVAPNLLLVGPSVLPELLAELSIEPADYGAYGTAGLASLPCFIIIPLLNVFLWGVIPLLVGNRMRRSKRREYPIEKERWERAVGRWQRLYYCFRDDGVFIPGETPFIPIDTMQEFLYAD